CLDRSIQQRGYMLAHHWSMLEPVPRSASDQPYILEPRVAVDQKIAGRCVFILADTRLHDWSARQRGEAFVDEGSDFGGSLDHSIASVRIERGAMPVESNFHSA